MDKQDFIFQLGKVKVNFILRIKSYGVNIDMSTFDITICDGYLSMRVECENAHGDVIAFKQNVYQEKETGQLYTGSTQRLC